MVKGYTAKESRIFEDPDAPVIIAPCHGRSHPGTSQMLEVLRYVYGWAFMPFFGSIGVDRVRSQAASMAMGQPKDYIFWCDDDNFAPVPAILRMAERVSELDLDVLAAVVPCRRTNTVANFSPLTDNEIIPLGRDGGVREVRSCGMAMALTHRRVFERLAKTLPTVTYGVAFSDEANDGWPFFLPEVDGEKKAHYGEDFSFCNRVRAAGMKLHVDTSVVGIHAHEAYLTLGDIEMEQDRRLAAEEQKNAVPLVFG